MDAPLAPAPPQALVITGMHRSGTSLLASILAAAAALGASPRVGPELAPMLRDLGAEDVAVDIVQPVLRSPEDLRITPRTMEAIAGPVIANGVADADEVARLVARLDDWAEEPGVVSTLPRTVQVAGRRPNR